MVRTWVRALGAAVLAAVVTGAGQLGIAYGLGILRWSQEFEDDRWRAHLAWAAFVAAVAVVGGAVGGVRTLRRYGVEHGFGAWIAVSLAALVGAAVTVPLVGLPAREADVAAPLDPALNAALAAGLGIAFGFFAALAVLCARPVAASVSVTAAWVWMVALVSASWELDSRGQRLGVVDVPALGERDIVLPVMIGIPVLAALAIAGYARWLGEHAVAVAACGLAGPALVAAAYLVAGPGSGRAQERPWLGALIAVGAGLVASLLVAVVRRRRPVEPAPAGQEDPGPAADTGATAANTGVGAPARAVAAVVPRPRDEYESWVSGLGGETRHGDAQRDDARHGDARRDDRPRPAGRQRHGAAEPDDPTETIGLGRPYVSHASD